MFCLPFLPSDRGHKALQIFRDSERSKRKKNITIATKSKVLLFVIGKDRDLKKKEERCVFRGINRNQH